MKYLYIATLVIVILLGIGLCVAIVFRHDIRVWNDYSVYMISKNYFLYKKNGGKFLNEFNGAINMDKYRDELMLGLTRSEILIKFPDAKSFDQYSPGSYRYNYIKYLNNNVSDIIYLDGKSEYEPGWAIEIDDKKFCVGIILVKG